MQLFLKKTHFFIVYFIFYIIIILLGLCASISAQSLERVGQWKMSQQLLTTNVYNAFQVVERNGSIAAEILRRNKIIFNYRDSQMYLRASSATDEPFEYNVLGIDIYTPSPNLPLYYPALFTKIYF